jgi:hypothetical protein
MNTKLASLVRRVVVVALAAAPVAVLAVTAAPKDAYAINSCSKVDIYIKNSHPSGDPIKIVYIKYQVNGAGSWYKEGLANKVPNSGNTASWADQDLGSFNEGSAGKFRVYFQRQLTAGLIPTYDDTHYVELDKMSETCTDGRDYHFNVQETGTKGE